MGRLIRSRVSVLLLLGFVFAVCVLLAPALAGEPQGTGASPRAALSGCPGKPMETQYVGKSESRSLPRAMANGKPLAGRYFEAGAHSYWHCHPGGQFMLVMEGKGRAQKRGQRMRDLAVGESEYAAPWEEHWHGASADMSVQYLQMSFLPTDPKQSNETLWMEPVSRDDYLGNDDGIKSRKWTAPLKPRRPLSVFHGGWAEGQWARRSECRGGSCCRRSRTARVCPRRPLQSRQSSTKQRLYGQFAPEQPK